MAVAFRAAGAVASGPATGGVAVPYPAGIVAGDLLVIQYTTYPSTTAPNTPSGWTKLFGPSAVSGTTNPKGHVFYKIAAGGETGTLTITHTGSDSGNFAAGIMVAYSGADTTTPVNIHTTGTGSGGVAPTATTTVTNTMVLRMHWCFMSATAITPAGGTTERYDTGVIAGTSVGIEMADAAQAAAGSTGTATISFTGGSNFGGLAATIAIAPSTGPPPSTFVPQIIIS